MITKARALSCLIRKAPGLFQPLLTIRFQAAASSARYCAAGSART